MQIQHTSHSGLSNPDSGIAGSTSVCQFGAKGLRVIFPKLGIATVCIVGALVLLWFWSRWDSGGGVLATLRRWISRSEGRIVVVDQPARRLVVNVGGRTTIGARLTNLTSRQVTVIGVESSCGCTAVEPIPLSVPAWGTADLTCKFNMDGRPAGSEYHGELRLLVDQPSPEIRLTVDIDIR